MVFSLDCCHTGAKGTHALCLCCRSADRSTLLGWVAIFHSHSNKQMWLVPTSLLSSRTFGIYPRLFPIPPNTGFTHRQGTLAELSGWSRLLVASIRYRLLGRQSSVDGQAILCAPRILQPTEHRPKFPAVQWPRRPSYLQIHLMGLLAFGCDPANCGCLSLLQTLRRISSGDLCIANVWRGYKGLCWSCQDCYARLGRRDFHEICARDTLHLQYTVASILRQTFWHSATRQVALSRRYGFSIRLRRQ